MAGPMDHGALSQEVVNLKEGHGTLRQEMRAMDVELRKEMRSLDSKMDSGFALLSQKLDTRGKVDWTPISILVSALLAIGAALYYPVREAISKHDAEIEMARREGETRIIKLWDATNATARDLAYLKGQLNPLPPK